MKFKISKRGLKGLCLLVGLFAYCFLLIFVNNALNSKPVTSVEKKTQPSSINIATNADLSNIYRIEDIEEIVEEEVIEPSEDVKGFRLIGSCEAGSGIEQPQLFCVGDTGGYTEYFDRGYGGVTEIDEETLRVHKDSSIEVTAIYIPHILFTGAFAPFDNVVEINNPEGKVAFRNAAEMINPEYDYLIHQPPGMGDRLEELDEDVGKKPFFMHFDVSFTDRVSSIFTESDRRFIFDNVGEKSGCPDVVNAGDFSVKKTNNLADDLTRSVTPPGMELGDRQFDGFCVDFNPDEHRITEHTREDSLLACQLSVAQRLWNFIVDSIFSAPKWDRCLDPEFEDESCEDYINLYGIAIDAPFGSVEKCGEDDCTVRYLEAGRLLSSPPTETQNLYPEGLPEEKYDDYVVEDTRIATTPCQVRIAGIAGYQWTRCIWDISAWQHRFQLERTFTYPGYENAFDEDEYWEKIEFEIKARGRGTYEARPSGPGETTNGATGDIKVPFPNDEWTDYALAAVRASNLMSLNPSDAADFFPNGEITEGGWVSLISYMAKLESNYNPNLTYEESFTNSKGEYVISTGLLQLSYESVSGYGFSGVTTEDLKDPKKNIVIGVKILETLIIRDGCISCTSGSSWRGGARYWSVLRTPKVTEIKNALK